MAFFIATWSFESTLRHVKPRIVEPMMTAACTRRRARFCASSRRRASFAMNTRPPAVMTFALRSVRIACVALLKPVMRSRKLPSWSILSCSAS